MKHGTRARYVGGCRCPLCTGANTLYHRERRGYDSNEAGERRRLLRRTCRGCGLVFETAPVLGVQAWVTPTLELACDTCFAGAEPTLAAILAEYPYGGHANALALGSPA